MNVLEIAAFGTKTAALMGTSNPRLAISGDDFPATQSVAAAAMACASDVDATAKLTADHQENSLAGLARNPSTYTSAMIANASIVPLINADLIRPLDDLIAQYGADIPARQLITIDGQVMAVAFMADAQHLIYRADILDELGLDVPTSYEDVLAAAEAIRAAGIMENPLGGTFAAGWNLGTEFVNMYLGTGGAFFENATAQVSIKNAQGVEALETMKALTDYMDPDYLKHDSDAAAAAWDAGSVALMNIWGSRAGALMDGDGTGGSTQVGGALTIGDSGIPASTLWWGGWTIAKNISDAEAAATFQAMAHASSPTLLNDETMPQAVWLMDGFEVQPVHEGVLATVAAGASPYPMLPFMGLLHRAAGDNIAGYLQGEKTAVKTLIDIEAAYTAEATAQGFLH